MNTREKIIRENIEAARGNNEHLTEWEREFIADIDVRITYSRYELTQNQFNRLQDIAASVKRKALGL